jgi:hypothetical protein
LDAETLFPNHRAEVTQPKHQHHGKSSLSSDENHYSDPAAAKLLSGIKRSMIAVTTEVGARYSQGKTDPAKAEKLIQENLQAYLSKAD